MNEKRKDPISPREASQYPDAAGCKPSTEERAERGSNLGEERSEHAGGPNPGEERGE